MQCETYERFPLRVVLLSNALAVAIYGIGIYILSGFGIWAAGLYVAYCLWMEYRVLRVSCVNCHYYGKMCGLGKGVLCAALFNRGDPEEFAKKEITWRHVLPDFMVTILPVLGGIALLTKRASWPLGAAMAALVLLTAFGNAVVRGSFVCKFCKQREIGCPAQKLFAGAGKSSE